jgi:hypothetical protein
MKSKTNYADRMYNCRRIAVADCPTTTVLVAHMYSYLGGCTVLVAGPKPPTQADIGVCTCMARTKIEIDDLDLDLDLWARLASNYCTALHIDALETTPS